MRARGGGTSSPSSEGGAGFPAREAQKQLIRMAKVRIRALKKNEIREASVLLRKALGTAHRDYPAKELEGEMAKYSEQGIRLLLARGGIIFRVAETDGRLVGIAIADLYPFMPANCWITWIAVKKAYRKRGIGKLLLKSFENEPA